MSYKLDPNLYVGNFKSKNGEIKILPGDKDNNIISKRNKILGHLNKVLSGGKRLKEKNISKYFQALGGKYTRNDVCISGDNLNCKGGRDISMEGAHKLLKLIKKENLIVDDALKTFKGSAPRLYEKLETKIKGGYNTIEYSSEGGSNNYLCEGNKPIKTLVAENTPAIAIDKVFDKYLKKYSENSSYLDSFQDNTNKLMEFYRNNKEKRRNVLKDGRNRRHEGCDIPNYVFPLYYAAIQVEYDNRWTKTNSCKGEERMRICDKRLNNMFLAWNNTLKFQKKKEENIKYRTSDTIDKLAKLACADLSNPNTREYKIRNVADHHKFMDEIGKPFNPDEEDTIDDLSTDPGIRDNDSLMDNRGGYESRYEPNFDNRGGYESRYEPNFDNRGGYESRYEEMYDNRGGYESRYEPNFDNRGGYESRYEEMYGGGEDFELNRFRSEIGRLNINSELVRLRDEINHIRYN
jgi:hypothetical protein